MYPTPILQERIHKAIAELTIPSTPQTLYEPIRYILGMGGKRIRPLVTLLSASLFGELDQVEAALPAALAVELFHNSTLMHDDIMDGAPLRRGRPTVHQRWDVNTAILSGDTMLIMAYQQLAKSNPTHLPALLDTFNQSVLEVCEGQQLDMDYEQRDQVTIVEYIEMIRMKTSVLVGCAAQLGAIAMGAATMDVRYVGDFGLNVGIAFQLQDDILDVFGDPDAVGKQVGGDILSNKKTYLLAKALDLAKGSDKVELAGLLNGKDLEPTEKIARVTAIYERLDVLKEAQNAKNRFSDLAFAALDRVGVNESRKKALFGLGRQLLDREY